MIEEERYLYCEEFGRNCPFDSRFRYCSCCELRTEVNNQKEKQLKLIDYDEIRNLFAEQFRKTAQLIRDGEMHLDNLAEGFLQADRVIGELPTVDAVVLPCQIGDEVWGLKKCRYRTSPAKGVVHHMYFGEDMRLCICVRNVCRGEWGRNVFPTKEEAELALAEMNKKETMAIVSSSQKENEHE